jgi:hemolysin D
MFEGLRRHAGILAESFRLDRERAKSHTPSAEPEFLPAALEVMETPPNPLGRTITWAIMIFLSIALLWACLGHVDMVAAAPGKVVPRGRVKVIQAADYGVVRAIRVSEGQAVRAGQPLMDLDPTTTVADVEQARQALLSADIDVARARALVAFGQGQAARFMPPAEADVTTVTTQRAFIEAKTREHANTLAALREEAAQRRGDVGMVEAEMIKLGQQLPLATEQLTGLETLSRRGYAPRMRVAEVRERVVALRQDLAIRREERRKAEAALAAVSQEMARARNEFSREALDALTEAEAARALRIEELKKADQKASLTVLTAPEAGVVQQMQVTTLGGVVKPADPLMIIVPKGVELVVEAMVLNRDAGFVHEGQAVEVKLEAYPFTRYGVVPGVVEHISRDAVDDEKQGLVFPARVRLSQSWIVVNGRRMPLSPGLSATAEIKTGERRIIEYLLSPLARRVQEAGRER